MFEVYHDYVANQTARFVKDVLKVSSGGTPQLDQAQVVKTLEALTCCGPEHAEAEARWYLENGQDGHIAMSSFLEKFRSEEAFLKRLDRGIDGAGGVFALKRTTDVIALREVELILPDGEASALTEAYRANKDSLSSFGESIVKYNKTWMKTWSRRWLMVDASGLHYSKRQDRTDVKTITLGQILDVVPILPGSVSRSKYRPGSFQVTTKEKKLHIFATENEQSSAEIWCEKIASHVLFHAVQHNFSIHRIKYFVELGANVNARLNEGKQQPILALSLACGATEVAEYLLRRGADPSCLLRWNFLMEGTLTASNVLDLLLSTKQDLNVCSDDTHGWTLLHYLAYDCALDSVEKVLSRVDNPTINAVNTLGDCSLLLALKRVYSNRTKAEELCMLLARRSEVHRRDRSGDSVLHLAIRQKYAKLAAHLIEQGVSVNELDAEGNSALHLALKTCQPSLVRQIALLSYSELDLKDAESGDTPLVIALKQQDEELALFLVENGAQCLDGSLNWGFSGNLGDKVNNDNALHFAIKSGFTRLSQAIIDTLSVEQAEDLLSKADSEGRPPLQLSIRTLQASLARVFVTKLRSKQGVPCASLDLPEEGGDGDTCLLLCFRLHLAEFASFLVDSGASTDARNHSGENSLHMLVRFIASQRVNHRVSIILQGLLTHLMRIDDKLCLAKNVEFEQTPLHLAVQLQENSTASLILAASPLMANEKDSNGENMMFYSVRIGDLSLCRLGIEHCADLNVVNASGDSLVHLAVVFGDSDILSLLLKHDAYVGLWDSAGMCPIHKAVEKLDSKAVITLAEKCKQTGHLELRNEQGYTSIMLAVLYGATSIARALLSYNVDLRCQLPHSRFGLLQVAAQECQKDPTTFFRSGMASVVLGIEKSRLQVNKVDEEARALIESAVQAVLDDGNEICLEEKDLDIVSQTSKWNLQEKAPDLNRERLNPLSNSTYCKVSPARVDQDLAEGLLSGLSPVVEKVILQRIKAEAKETAEEWLNSRSGQAMLNQQASDCGQHKDGQEGNNQLKAEFRKSFIENHVQESVNAFYAIKT